MSNAVATALYTTLYNDTEPEMIDNPDYEPEMIDNPDYPDDPNAPEMIDNPDYEPEMIDNPDYPDDPNAPEMIDNPDYEPEMIDNPDYPDLMELGVTVYSGVARRDAEYPFITIMPIADVPILYQGDDPSTSQTMWDLKIWAEKMKDVGEIYDRIVKILDTQISVDFGQHDTRTSTSLRGRGMPLMTEENRPNEILYSRVIECEVIF